MEPRRTSGTVFCQHLPATAKVADRQNYSTNTAFAVQTRLLALAAYRGQRLFRCTPGTITHHTVDETSCPARRVLQFGKAERDLLGGWSSDGSERYTRVARHLITFMQQSVANTFRRHEVNDPLAESDDIDAFVDFLETPDVLEIASS